MKSNSCVALLAMIVIVSLPGCETTQFNLNAVSERLSATPPGFQTGISIESLDANELASEEAATSIRFLSMRNANYVQIVVPWYQEFHFDNEMQSSVSSTPSEEAISKAISTARLFNMGIFLSPRIIVPTAHRDLIYPDDIDEWFDNYRRFILHYAEIASSHNVEMLSIGTALSQMSQFTDRWQTLIDSVRTHYRGDLIYSAYYNEYTMVEFWKDLDFIGIEAFFPLTTINEPQPRQLLEAWYPWVEEIEKTAEQYRMPVIFTSIGYTSQDGTNRIPGEKSINVKLDLIEQALCFKVFFDTFIGKDWLHGVYIWGWTATLTGGLENLYYTPRNKPADTIIRGYFQQLNAAAWGF